MSNQLAQKPVVSRRNFLKATAALSITAGVVGGQGPLLRAAGKRAYAAQNDEEKLIPTFCAMCGPSQGCGIYARVVGGRFVGIEGMPESPLNKGKNCAKAHGAPQWVYSPERIRYPMKRVGEKGEGKFERITWDEAIDIIAKKLTEQKEKYGPESLGTLSPARRTYSDYIYRFLCTHGSPNYGHSGICAIQQMFTYSYTIGPSGICPTADYKGADLLVIWGKQPVYSGAAKGGVANLVAAKQRGAKIIAVKPSIEPDSSMADEWVPVRPGTDAALVLAMLQVITSENLIDTDFVASWCYGYDELKAHVQQYTPAWAEPICGVPAQQIIDFARLYATTKKASIETGNGLEHTPSCSAAVQALGSLMAITGHLDRPGCNFWSTGSTMPAVKTVHLRERYTQEWVDKLVGPEMPRAFEPFIEGTSSAYYRLFDSVLTEDPYPIRTIIAPGSQPTVSTRGTKRILEALKKLEFYVVVDVTRTAEMDFADVVVPVTTMYEVDHPFEAGSGWVMARNKVIEPLGEYKSDYQFWMDLGVKMGYGADWWNGDINACMDYQLENFEMTMEELRANHPTGIIYAPKPMAYEKYATQFAAKSPRLDKSPYLPQGKVALYNTSFEAAGYDPLPTWRELPEGPTATPELLEKYPLLLSDYHTSKAYNASWLRNVPYLRQVEQDPVLHIHPDTAKERGIKDGDWVIVEGPHGWIKLKAMHYPGIRPDTVMALHGWWQGCQELGIEDMPLTDGGANTNNMYTTDSAKMFDPLVTAMSSQTLVQVRKA